MTTLVNGTAPKCDDSLKGKCSNSDRPVIIAYQPKLPTSACPVFVDEAFYLNVRKDAQKVSELTVPPKDARAWTVKKGQLFRICCTEGSQVGDLNLWSRADPKKERFYASKTRQLHATHLTTFHRLWSNFPFLRPLATITHDTLAYGFDEDGAGVHDVIGSRCDPYTNKMLTGEEYDRCCHSNLTRAVAPFGLSETDVHDVLNVFMCTGFTKTTHQYFMKASPVRPGDFIEFYAEMDLLCALSACPGGDCGQTASGASDCAAFALRVEIWEPAAPISESSPPLSQQGVNLGQN
uniref:DUF1989 domain-containing protein n=1 Tax=Chromera velia CCMP2878 TaxID=1169474 RepID=A0A0G4F347_9ALVE|eukprot:Cvel_14806.t1-p1 / transcript=Cvel_14806.t1 / gene=Cvel_14806 / organism=Chromera_velia_CCMP2878 / gene_product=Uncharacterized protein C11D3.03c, putative / transcript_product=Uncharacterized protein C11D3.03c, putative / location=Cvel_scaffold1068:32453-33328(-) / protein_length=292 / sequence_SO=supercontig / SO=protein_coding / is_pseudo=false